MRVLSFNEIEAVSGGGSLAARVAIDGISSAIGGAIGATAGEMSGAEFGALVGGALCSPGGPEASAACAAIGGYAGISIGSVSGRDAGAAAGVAIGEYIYEQIQSAGDFMGVDYSPDSFGSDGGFDTSNSFVSDFGGYSGGGGGGGDGDNQYVQLC